MRIQQSHQYAHSFIHTHSHTLAAGSARVRSSEGNRSALRRASCSRVATFSTSLFSTFSFGDWLCESSPLSFCFFLNNRQVKEKTYSKNYTDCHIYIKKRLKCLLRPILWHQAGPETFFLFCLFLSDLLRLVFPRCYRSSSRCTTTGGNLSFYLDLTLDSSCCTN